MKKQINPNTDISSYNLGFSFISIVISVGIISVIAGIFFLQSNPTSQLSDVRNAERRVHVLIIMDALNKYLTDNDGIIPANIMNAEECASGFGRSIGTERGMTDLHSILVSSSTSYLTVIPRDPRAATPSDSGYAISRDTQGRLTVCAPLAENTEISLTR